MRNAKEAGLTDRITAIEAVAKKLPFRDNSIDLVISRSSVMFWNDLVAGFDEIYRVLKPGGNTYIGAGFGCKELKESIFAKMEVKQPGWGAKRKERLSPENQQRIQAALDKSAVCKYRMHKTETGFWICISKG
jgi:ubiquinone/menaquinone biosynthesis C-methylase UbiE